MTVNVDEMMDATVVLNRDPLAHCRITVGQMLDSDRIGVVIRPTAVYQGIIEAASVMERAVSSQTLLWEHQVKALEHFVAILQLALDRTREALEHRRQQERAL